MEPRWDASADVVIVGFGAAGACAAITAADLGASVVVLEKQPESWHTPSTAASGGQVTAVTDPVKALRYFHRCAGGMIPIEVSAAWVARATDVISWLETVAGVKMTRVAGAEHPDWDGADAVAAHGPAEAYQWGEDTFRVVSSMPAAERPARRPVPGGGDALFSALRRATTGRDRIEVVYERPAGRLILDQDHRVVGVEASTPAGPLRYRAERGVILTCGGYEYDEEMKLGYLRASPVHFYASPMNTGDGVRMAQAVGADLWHMNSMVGRAIAHFEMDGRPYNFSVSIGPGGYLFTDKHGRRFTNEAMQSRHDFYYELLVYDAARAEHPRIPCYWFFDRRRMIGGPLVSGSAAAGPYRYEWSPDNRDEIARGWVHEADDLEDLARQAGIGDAQRAAHTIAEYNEACRTKRDPMGRPPASLLPLDEPPYYCVRLWPGGPNTSGGPRRNERAQVIDVFGRPIPGLYEAGELGEAVGALYPANGGNLSDALCFGRIAAESCVRAERAGDLTSRGAALS